MGRKVAAAFAPMLFIFSTGSAQAMPASFTKLDRADAVCLIAFIAALESLVVDEQTAEQRVGFTSVVTYFIGKLRGRHPALRMTDLLAPSYILSLQDEVAAASSRCAQEAIELGGELKKAGQILMDTEVRPQASS